MTWMVTRAMDKDRWTSLENTINFLVADVELLATLVIDWKVLN